MKKTERSKPSAGRTSRASYRRHPMSLVQRIAVTASAVITFAILAALIAYILIMGVPNLKPGLFAWHYTSDNCSMTPAIINTLLMVVLSLLLSVPFGIGAAIYLVEYAKRGNKLVKVVRLTAETLSGIPSIVYGLFGYLIGSAFLANIGMGYIFQHFGWDGGFIALIGACVLSIGFSASTWNREKQYIA